MAYLDLKTRYPELADDAPAHGIDHQPVGPTLGHVERVVLRLSRKDSLASLRPRNRFDRVLESMFGIKRANPLASPRMEALRQFAVTAHRSGTAAASKRVSALLSHGFTASQASLILAECGR